MMPIPSRSHIRPNCVTGTSPRSNSFSVASRTYTFFQSVYSATGTPYFSIHLRSTPAAAQIVSWAPNRPSVVAVASSTRFIRQPSRQHPPPQRLGMHLHLVFPRQMLTGQCRSESFPDHAAVLLPQQPDDLCA